MITPHVVPNLPTATELTLEFKRAMRKAYDLIRTKEQEEQDLINKRREEEMRELQKQQPKEPPTATPPDGGSPEPEKKGPGAFLRPSVPEVFAGSRQKSA